METVMDFCLLLKIWAKANTSKNLSRKLLDYAKKAATEAFKTPTKIANKITKVSKSWMQNDLEIVESKTEIPKKIYIPPEKTSKLLMI